MCHSWELFLPFVCRLMPSLECYPILDVATDRRLCLSCRSLTQQALFSINHRVVIGGIAIVIRFERTLNVLGVVFAPWTTTSAQERLVLDYPEFFAVVKSETGHIYIFYNTKYLLSAHHNIRLYTMIVWELLRLRISASLTLTALRRRYLSWRIVQFWESEDRGDRHRHVLDAHWGRTRD